MLCGRVLLLDYNFCGPKISYGATASTIERILLLEVYTRAVSLSFVRVFSLSTDRPEVVRVSSLLLRLIVVLVSGVLFGRNQTRGPVEVS